MHRRSQYPNENYSLFDMVSEAFCEQPDGVRTQDLYDHVSRRTGSALSKPEPVGKRGASHSKDERAVRWMQQTLKQLGLAEPIANRRGLWRLTESGKRKLTPAKREQVMIACSTSLGLALWGNYEDVFSRLDVPITLCLTSPPYPLAKPRAYGGPTRDEYVDFVCGALEPIVRNLRPGGNIALNISNDIFETRSPARSLYRERLAIALFERLGLHKMDELIWNNPCKPPGPIHWSSIHRFQLTSTWEPVLWFTNDPGRVVADNRRVLVPHKSAQKNLMARGGDGRCRSYGDGAYSLRPDSFGRVTAGAIPRNILSHAHNCPSKQSAAEYARSEGLPVHGATMPLSLADFLVRYLSAADDLVVDPFAGWGTTAVAAERNQRRWIVAERMREYAAVIGSRLG